jgi:hypothetical protein
VQKGLDPGERAGLVVARDIEPEARAAMWTSSSPSRRLVTIWAAVSCAGSTLASRWAAKVDLPAPTSPVMTMKPSAWARP